MDDIYTEQYTDYDYITMARAALNRKSNSVVAELEEECMPNETKLYDEIDEIYTLAEKLRINGFIDDKVSIIRDFLKKRDQYVLDKVKQNTVIPEQNGFIKHDDGKVRWDLLPMSCVEEVAKVYQYGLRDHGEYNWVKGTKWSRFVSATSRHWMDWLMGKKVDEDSGLSPLAHMAWNIFTLMCYERYNIGEDDRNRL